MNSPFIIDEAFRSLWGAIPFALWGHCFLTGIGIMPFAFCVATTLPFFCPFILPVVPGFASEATDLRGGWKMW